MLDDCLLTPPSVVEAKDLLELIDDRSQMRSTLAARDPTLADAILDRLVRTMPIGWH